MSLPCRGLKAAIRPSKQLLKRQQRRFDSHDAHHGSSESAFHAESGARGSESFGWIFYGGLASIPAVILLYSAATSTETGAFTRFINAYRAREERLTHENMLNQAMVEFAAEERHRFVGKVQEVTGPDFGYPEAFNSSSPWNVVAGQGGADLTRLMQHYTERKDTAEEARVARIKHGKITSVYDDTSPATRFPGVADPGRKPIDPSEIR